MKPSGSHCLRGALCQRVNTTKAFQPNVRSSLAQSPHGGVAGIAAHGHGHRLTNKDAWQLLVAVVVVFSLCCGCIVVVVVVVVLLVVVVVVAAVLRMFVVLVQFVYRL